MINVTDKAEAIDSGLDYEMKGLFGGYKTYRDYSRMKATFLDVNGNQLGISPSIGVSHPSDWGGENNIALVPRSTSGTVPVGTRFIRIDVQFTLEEPGYFANGMADNLEFRLLSAR